MSKYTNIIAPKELEVGTKSSLVLSVTKVKDGDPYVDIRTYIKSDDYSGPTKKGVSFPLELLEILIQMLEDVNEECELKGE